MNAKKMPFPTAGGSYTWDGASLTREPDPVMPDDAATTSAAQDAPSDDTPAQATRGRRRTTSTEE